MDYQGLNFAQCGYTTDPVLNKKTSYYAGFLASYTLGLNLNFHLTFEFYKSALYCFTYYYGNDYIYTAFSH